MSSLDTTGVIKKTLLKSVNYTLKARVFVFLLLCLCGQDWHQWLECVNRNEVAVLMKTSDWAQRSPSRMRSDTSE